MPTNVSELPSGAMLGRRCAFRALLLLLVSIGAACGGKLDRSKAEDLIVARLKSVPVATCAFHVGQRYEMKGGRTAWVEALKLKGLVKDAIIGAEWPYERHFTELTPEGLKYKVGEHSVMTHEEGLRTFALMKAADQTFVSITGIRESPGGVDAQVEFTWKYLNLTPFGEVAPLLSTVSGRGALDYSTDRAHTETVTLTKYDDGWRLPVGWSLPVQRTGYE